MGHNYVQEHGRVDEMGGVVSHVDVRVKIVWMAYEDESPRFILFVFVVVFSSYYYFYFLSRKAFIPSTHTTYPHCHSP